MVRTTPWQRLADLREEHARAHARVLCAEQFAHLGPDRALELARAREEERQRALEVERAQAKVDALRREAEERARVIAPEPADHDVRGLLIRLERHYLPQTWEDALRQRGDPVSLRALRHLGWLSARRGAL